MSADVSLKPELPQGRLTASKLALAQKCPGSFTIGHVQTEGPASRAGIQIHRFLEKMLADGQLRFDLTTDPKAHAVCQKIDSLDVLDTVRAGLTGPVEILPEIAFGISPDGTEALVLPEAEVHRDYSKAPEGWVCGTADVVVISEHEKTAAVTDWKTGVLASVAPAEENLQLRFHALAAARVYGVERVIAQVAFVGPDGAINPSPCEFGPEDFEQIARELQEITGSVARVGEGAGLQNAQPAFVVGEHCRYCPAFAACPAQAGTAQALLDEKTEELTPETAAAAWQRLLAVEAATKKVRRALQDYLVGREEGVPLGGEAELGLAVSQRDTIVPGVAMPILRERYGDVADGAVSVTKKGLRGVAGDETPDILREIEEKDGLSTRYSESLKERRT